LHTSAETALIVEGIGRYFNEIVSSLEVLGAERSHSMNLGEGVMADVWALPGTGTVYTGYRT